MFYVYGEKDEDGLWRVKSMSIHVGRKQVLVWWELHAEKGFHP